MRGSADMASRHSQQETLLLQALRSEGSLTMEQVAARFPQLSWGELFLAVDRLSRSGELVIRRRGYDYDLHVTAHAAVQEADRLTVNPDP